MLRVLLLSLVLLQVTGDNDAQGDAQGDAQSSPNLGPGASLTPFLTAFDGPGDVALDAIVWAHAADRRLVGLGEVSHFTRECYDLKRAMVGTLIELGYDGLILEVDFGQALLWDDHVVHGRGELDALISGCGWFTYRTEEFKALLADVREHNRTAEVPFRIFGMEMTAVHHNLPWLAAYLERESGGGKELVVRLRAPRKTVVFGTHSSAEQAAYWKLFHDARTALASLGEPVGAADKRERAVAERIVEILRQYATYASQDDMSLQVALRDLFSTRNVLWCLDQMGPESQAAIWAHNGHIEKAHANSRYEVLGHHLARLFGAAYLAVGFTFHSGACGAFGDEGFQRVEFGRITDGETSLTADLASAGEAFLVLDVEAAVTSDPRHQSPLRTPQRLRANVSESFGSGSRRWMELCVAEAYDVLIYVDEMHYPTPVPWSR